MLSSCVLQGILDLGNNSFQIQCPRMNARYQISIPGTTSLCASTLGRRMYFLGASLPTTQLAATSVMTDLSRNHLNCASQPFLLCLSGLTSLVAFYVHHNGFVGTVSSKYFGQPSAAILNSRSTTRLLLLFRQLS